MFLRITALCGLLCLLTSAAFAQSNQLSFDNITASPGEERTIALNGTLTSGMDGLVVTVLFDPSVIQVLDVNTTDITDDFTLSSSVSNGRLTIAMAAANTITSFFPEAMLNLTIRVIGSPGAVTQLDIVSTVLNEGDVSATAIDGSLTVLRQASIVGWVLYYADLQAVPDVLLAATGEASVDGITGTDGRYEIGPTPVGDYDVALSRDDGSLDAIDALDAVDILRHLIGNISLSEGQQFVADVSGNGVIGTTDASLILRFLVGLETDFPAGDFWQFAPSSMRFQPLIQDEFRNITAYLVGDVDGSWETAGGTGKRLAGGPSLRMKRAPSTQARRVELTLGGTDLEALRGGSLEIRYDRRALRAVDVDRLLERDYLLATNLEQPGVIRVAFAGVSGVDGAAPLVRLQFEEIGRRGTNTTIRVASARLNRTNLGPAALASFEFQVGRRLSDLNADGHVDLSDFFLLADNLGSRDLSYDLNGDGAVDMGDLFVMFDELGSGRGKALAAAAERGLIQAPGLEQNAPNPFNAETLIRFRTSIDAPVSLRIYDLAGQRIRDLWSGQVTAGEHVVTWDGRDNAGRNVASGTYIYRLQSNVGAVQKKLLLLR